MNRAALRWVGLLVAFGGIGCTASDPGLAVEELIPAGSNAAFVSSTIPLAMNPGERLDVSVTMQNTGTADPANTWTRSGPTYAFFRTGATSFGLNYDTLETVTTVGNTTVFNFVITAPTTPGTYTFTGQMGIVGDPTRFGQVVSISGIDVAAGNPRRWACAFEPVGSSIPTTMAPGENGSFTVVVRNTGTATWTAPGHLLYSQDSPIALWNNVNRAITTTVAPGATATVVVPVTAPATTGSHRFRRQVYTNTLGFFDNFNSCVDQTITVGGSPALDAALVSNTLPAVLAPNETRSVTVTMRNTGTATWPSGTTIYLRSANTPVSLYGVDLAYPPGSTAPAATQTFSFVIRAPSTPGSYSQVWRVYDNATGFFGATLNVPLTVDAGATPALDAAVSSQNIPTLVSAGRPATFLITMQNTGTGTWAGSSYSLYSTNSPLSLWGVNLRMLGAADSVAPTATYLFTLNVTAPATPGTYSSRWRMYNSTSGFFGTEAVTTMIAVTLCGNGTVDGGEQCDDSNLTSGDGCSSTCQTETVSYDLLTDVMDRTLIESSINHQLTTVALADVSGDSVVDVIVADATHVTPATGPFRNAAGTVVGYSGGASFFTSSSTTLPAGNLFRVFGATAGDRLGAGTVADIDTGDVSGDSIADLVVSAALADGEMDARADAGEVYVLTGGSGLTGDIDLGAATPPTALRARIIGAAAGDRLVVLAVGDLSGDGTEDLVLGAPFADSANGVDSGAVYVVLGGATLTGTIDLAAPGAATVYTISGPTAGAKLGLTAEVGNFVGSATSDLLIGNPHFTSGGLSRAGAVWGFVGPMAADRNLATAVGSPTGASIAWLGASQNDNFGSAVAVGNVVGTSAADVVVGAYQQRRAGLQVGAVDVFDGAALVLGTTYDLALGATPTVTFLGADQFDNAGTSLSLGDMDGDGYLDIPVASGLADGPGNGRLGCGEVAVYFGSATLSGTIDLGVTPARVHIDGGAASDGLGLHGPGIAMADIDGDGRADLCVGSFQGGAARGGRVDCVQSPF